MTVEATDAAWEAAEESKEIETPPTEDLVRSSNPPELADGEGMPILRGIAAKFDEWTEISNPLEGHFMERFASGSFAKTITERGDRIRCLFHHGLDPTVGMKPLGPITSLSEDSDGLRYEVQLLDVDYVRSLLPSIEAGLFGSSFRFGVVRKNDVRYPARSDSNPYRILERTVTESRLKELGPTPFPQYAGTTAAVRSLTQEFVLARIPREVLLRHALGDDVIREILNAEEPDEGASRADAPSETEAAEHGTSVTSAANQTPVPLHGTDRKEQPSWLLP